MEDTAADGPHHPDMMRDAPLLDNVISVSSPSRAMRKQAS